MWILYLVFVAAGITQLPVLIDVLQQLFPNAGITRAVSLAAKPVLIAFLLLLHVLALYLFFTMFIYSAVTSAASVMGVLHISFVVWLAVNMLWNYSVAVLRDPGRQTSTAAKPVSTTGPASRQHDGVRWCKSCDHEKAPGTHHCRSCRACIIGMDHHCPVTGNCVGSANYRAFFLWMLYSACGWTYAGILSFPPFWQCLLSDLFGFSNQASPLPPVCKLTGPFALVFVPTFCGAIVVSVLLFFQLYLLSTSQTTMSVIGRFCAPARKNRNAKHGVAEQSKSAGSSDTVKADRSSGDHGQSPSIRDAHIEHKKPIVGHKSPSLKVFIRNFGRLVLRGQSVFRLLLPSL